MSPIIPHFASECLETLKAGDIKTLLLWPKVNKDILIENTINFVVQINGKKRAILNLEKGLTEEQLLKKISNNEKLKNYMDNKSIKNTIFIPDKLVNIIITS